MIIGLFNTTIGFVSMFLVTKVILSYVFFTWILSRMLSGKL